MSFQKYHGGKSDSGGKVDLDEEQVESNGEPVSKKQNLKQKKPKQKVPVYSSCGEAGNEPFPNPPPPKSRSPLLDSPSFQSASNTSMQHSVTRTSTPQGLERAPKSRSFSDWPERDWPKCTCARK